MKNLSARTIQNLIGLPAAIVRDRCRAVDIGKDGCLLYAMDEAKKVLADYREHKRGLRALRSMRYARGFCTKRVGAEFCRSRRIPGFCYCEEHLTESQKRRLK